MISERRALIVVLAGIAMLVWQVGMAAAQVQPNQNQGNAPQQPGSDLDQDQPAADDAGAQRDSAAQNQQRTQNRTQDQLENQPRERVQDRTQQQFQDRDDPERLREPAQREEIQQRPADDRQRGDQRRDDFRNQDRDNFRGQDDMEMGLQFDARADVEEGVAISDVRPDSPAARAGLRPGDVIVSVDGRRFDSGDRINTFLSDRSGDRVPVIVRRDGREQTLFLMPASPRQFSQYRDQRAYDGRGYDGEYADDSFRSQYRGPQGQGAHHYRGAPSAIGVRVHNGQWGPVVDGIYEGGPAQQAGLRHGDTIMRINGQQVCNADHFVNSVQRVPAGERLHVTYYRDGRYGETELMPGPTDEVFASRLITQPQWQEGMAWNDRRFDMNQGDRFGTSPPPSQGERVARGEFDRQGQPRSALRPDIEGMAQIEEMQQEIDNLRQEVESLRSELTELRRTQRGGAEIPEDRTQPAPQTSPQPEGADIPPASPPQEADEDL